MQRTLFVPNFLLEVNSFGHEKIVLIRRGFELDRTSELGCSRPATAIVGRSKAVIRVGVFFILEECNVF